ncbi:MAG TPA: aminotransferase class V-fold PLP-dependent enzyme, partial [Xanthobacteraceae bacterium]|nr:aminotransferase class V-fold PLP-dependent enzyme [Xanthobacteraceae bacterium]
MPGFKGLAVPGPTNMPFHVRQAMDVALEDHRAPDFPQFTLPLFTDLKEIFQTKSGQIFIFPASGTGGWESAIANTLSPGDKVLASVFGQFSLLWVDLCQRFGLDVDAVDVEWGKGVPLDQYQQRLAADKAHKIKAVLVTHNETATGVTSDVVGVRKILNELKHPALLFVDGVSSVASIDFRMDEWGVDIVVAGSQKGFMLPTGLAIVCVSQKALKAGETAKMPRCFFDYRDMIKSNAQGYFPYTPATTLLRGLRASV